MTKIMLLAACCAIGSSGASSTPSTFWSDIDRHISVIHRLDWTRLSADDIQRMIPMVLTRIEADVPKDSQYRLGDCGGSTYMQTGSGRNLISFEFNKVLESDRKCGTRLRAIRADVILDSSKAEVSRLRVIEQLGAAGSVMSDFAEYQWRSDDSRTKNVLTTSVLPRTDGNHSKLLSIKLRHIPVTPEAVDGLPFHKGYFPPACEANKN
jgi:hypothetical protein